MFLPLLVPVAAGPAWYWWVLIAAGAAGVLALGLYLLFRWGRGTKAKRTSSRAMKGSKE
jgi:hypothetical protein